MRELKLKYFIDLVSNLGTKARSDAQAIEQSQRAMQAAVDKTGGSLQRLDSAYARFAAGNATERQVGYMHRLSQGIDQASAKMRGLGQLVHTGLQKAPGALAGVAGGLYAAKAMIDKPMDYDMRLRGVTATALAGKSIGELRSGQADINQLVVNAVRQAPGATRDSTLIAFEKLVGSGSFSLDESKSLLPTIMRTSVASGADANDLVQAAEKMKVSLKLAPDQIGVALSKVMRAGQEGGFEIKDSAKWMGPLLPYMKGYTGMAGVESLVTMLQQVRATAGTNDEAANNLRNFLQKMGADSTNKDFKKQGIDLHGEMAKGIVRGETPVETYMGLLEKVMAKQDPEGKARAAMRQADKSLSPEERQQRYDSIAEMYKSAGISKIINDLQEMGGYSALAKTKEYGKKVAAAVHEENGGAVNTGFTFMSEGTGAKFTAAANEKDIAMTGAFAGKSGVFNTLLDGAIGLSREFPSVAIAATGVTTALTALGAAAGLFALLAARNGGGGLPGTGGLAGGKAGAPLKWPVLEGATPTAGASAGGKAMSFIKGLGILGSVAAVGSELFTTSDEDLATLRAADARKSAERTADLPMNARGRGFNDPRLLTLTTPSIAEQALAMGQPTKIELGEGKLTVSVLVTQQPNGDWQTTANPLITQQPSIIKLNAGSTNPGGFSK